MSFKNVDDIYALSPAQQGMLFHTLYAPHTGAYTVQVCWTLDGPLVIPYLKQAWQCVVEHYPILRTSFVWEGLEKPLQVVRRQRFEVPWQQFDWRAMAANEQAARWETFLETDRGQDFRLAKAPLLRLSLFQFAEHSYRFVWSYHHLLLDGWSHPQVLQEVFAAYKALCKGQDPRPLDRRPYRDYIAWLREQDLSQAEAFWRQTLKGFTAPTKLPADRLPEKRSDQPEIHSAEQELTLSEETTTALRAFARSHQLTLNTLVQGAWALLLSHYSGERDVVYGTVVSGRPADLVGAESMIGLFVNTLPMRVLVSPRTMLLPWLKDLQNQQVELRQYEYSPLVQVQGWSEVPRGLPLFETILIFENHPMVPMAPEEQPDLILSPASTFTRTNYALELIVVPHATLALHLSYDCACFASDTIQRMLSHFQNIVENILLSASKPLSALHLLNAAEQRLIVEEWNATTQSVMARPESVQQLIEAQVERTPDAPAVLFAHKMLTYRELNAQANQLAYYLRRLGVGPDCIVGVSLERSLELIVTLLGILKAGGAYTPLDPDLPPDRLAFLLENLNASAHGRTTMLLTQTYLALKLRQASAKANLICLDAVWDQITGEQQSNPHWKVNPSNLAYVIYTSGSTGQPKGVMNSHQGICNRLLWTQATYPLDASDCVLQKTPFSFDISVCEIFWPLFAGARLVVARPGGHKDSAYLASIVQAEQVTTIHFVPSMLQAFLDEPGLEACVSLRRFISGGEELPYTLQERFFARHPAALYNLYGPTEAAVEAAHWTCQRQSQLPIVPIGYPIANMQLYILNSEMQPVPVGVQGELFIGGIGVARGYLARPDLTAERFVPDPFSQVPGARIYRTGDLARYLPDGAIAYLGRGDYQVKLRGFRIELGEIEAALEQHPAVRSAVVLLREDLPGDKWLVAYLVSALPPGENQPLSNSELRQYLLKWLPEYMLPAIFVWLDALPLLPNGKINRYALPAPERNRPEDAARYLAPRTPIEQQVTKLWADLFQLERISITDNFFELGGHSILAIRLVGQIQLLFQTRVALHTLFANPTIAGLALAIVQAQHGTESLPEQPESKDNVIEARQDLFPADVPITARESMTEWLPLSFEQQRLWFIDQLTPGNPAYNSPVAVRLNGPLDVCVLRDALNEIIKRHEVLRTTFTIHNGQPVQIINTTVTVPLSVRDLSELPASEREYTATQLIGEEGRRSFDITHGPVLRAQVLRLTPEQHIFLLVFHHITIDAWSIGVFFRELTLLYEAHRRGQQSPLPALSLQYADYALWQRRTLRESVLDRSLAYWRQHLADLPVLHLPVDHLHPSDSFQQGMKYSIALPQTFKKGLQAISQQEQVTLFMTMLAAFQILLVHYSGQEDIVVGSSTTTRSRREVDDLIGFFVNLLVLRTDLSGAPSYREVLQRVREVCLHAYAYQDLPFERLVQELHPERDPLRTPFFRVLFQAIEGSADNSAFADLTLEPMTVEGATSKFDLLLNIREALGQEIIVDVEYRTACFGEEFIRRMLGHYQIVLAALLANPDQSINSLSLLTPHEQEQMLENWNQTQTLYPHDMCLHELIEVSARNQPGAIALIHEGLQLTYAQINARANQLAHYLQRRGVGPDVVVGLCVERSTEMVIGLLGILKAGGAYMPLDPAYPEERLAFMLAEASAPVLLTLARLLPDLPKTTGAVVCLDTEWIQIAQESCDNPVSEVSPAHLAYIISTSGSTGVPKGIAVLHRGVVNNVLDLNQRFAVSPLDSVLALSSLSFDMCVYEVLGILIAGGTIVLPSNAATRDPASWVDLLTRYQITIWNSAPSLLELLVSYCEQSHSAHTLHLRLALLGGDWIPVTLPERLGTLVPGIQFISLGGATEASIHSIIFPVEKSDPTWKSIPYGRPMENQQAYILDANLYPVPIGVAGELHLGGVGLARGYLHRPDLTAGKFIPHPFSRKAGERLYKTGDLARFSPDGTIELLGRMDFLVKIHGLRIELGEIEAVLRQYSTLQDVIVLVKEDRAGDKQLVAYIVLQGGEPNPVAELRTFLAGKLPDYMQPKAFVFLDRLPLSPNGKIDRNALPELDQKTYYQTRKALVAPRNALEKRLIEVWSTVLGLDQVGIDDDFFELGGDSFKAIRATRACDETLTLLNFFKNSTVSRLAAYLRQNLEHATQFLHELTPPLAKPKLALICVPYGGGNAVSYQPFANNLPTGLSLYAVALPGHDFASQHEPLQSLEAVARGCVEEIVAMEDKAPLALYGQCAGAALTIEICRLLEQRDVPIAAVYLGAALPDRDPLRSIEFERDVSDEEMLEWLRSLGGFEDVLEASEIDHIMKVVRHDLLGATNYYKEAYASPPIRLKTPIYCIIGTEDAATRDYETRFQEWSYFGESVKLNVIQGANHYFVKHEARELAGMINDI